MKQSFLRDIYVWGVNSTVTKHSDYFVWNDTSERVAQPCDVVGPFEVEKEGTGVASDVVKVEGEDPATPGPLI